MIVFSPTYDRSHQGEYFFDIGPNMLNVAVSRARDSFIVLGEMSLFAPDQPGKASGLLGRYLFASREHEITALPLQPDPVRKVTDEIYRLDTLSKHRKVLHKCFDRARENVVVISPFISEWAVKEDDIPRRVREAVARGVDVQIFTDPQLNRGSNGEEKPHFREGCRLLEESGARLHRVKQVHAKTLCRDGVALAEGSFNWLSAVRDKRSEWQRYEVSLVYKGPKVAEWIEETLRELEGRSID